MSVDSLLLFTTMVKNKGSMKYYLVISIYIIELNRRYKSILRKKGPLKSRRMAVCCMK